MCAARTARPSRRTACATSAACSTRMVFNGRRGRRVSCSVPVPSRLFLYSRVAAMAWGPRICPRRVRAPVQPLRRRRDSSRVDGVPRFLAPADHDSLLPADLLRTADPHAPARSQKYTFTRQDPSRRRISVAGSPRAAPRRPACPGARSSRSRRRPLTLARSPPGAP